MIKPTADVDTPELAAHQRWTAVSIAIVAIRVIGLVAVALITLRGAVARADPPEINLVVSLGVLCLAGFLWLALSGFFGYGSVRRSDWVGLLPSSVALVVREVCTLHSVQEIEIQFAQGPIAKHSVVYPLLQMFFVPIVRDTQSFTMHMNGVLGAFACVSMYLFVRQRLESRTAGFLCALFLASHPLVARFSPTDGPYSLLLAAWFSGLALLSARPLDARGMFGGVVLVGIAATTRMEGLMLLPASLLMLDPRVLISGVRRHRIAAVFLLLVLAALLAVQMHFLLPAQLQSGPLRRSGPPLLDALVWAFTNNLASPRGTSTAWKMLDDFIWLVACNGRVYVALVVIGAVSGVATRRWLGLLAFIAMMVVVAPVVNSTHTVALHRLVPACALQAMVAGIGAYSLTAWTPRTSRLRWLATVPGALVAFYVLAAHWNDLTRPYVFTEEYDLVRSHLAPGGVPAQDCTLMTFKPESDIDIHDFGQVVPETRVLDCRGTDCLAELSDSSCLYYVRSAACYFHAAGVPPGCAIAGTTEAGDRLGCMSEPSASFERSVDLEPVEIRTIDIRNTFAEWSQSYPQRAEIGLFRIRPKSVAPRRHDS